MTSVYLKDWALKDDYAELTYSDGDVLKVSKEDFNRAFGPIISASKEAVVRDFAVKPGLAEQIKSAQAVQAENHDSATSKEVDKDHAGSLANEER